jgi:hypothetical protein
MRVLHRRVGVLERQAQLQRLLEHGGRQLQPGPMAARAHRRAQRLDRVVQAARETPGQGEGARQHEGAADHQHRDGSPARRSQLVARDPDHDRPAGALRTAEGRPAGGAKQVQHDGRAFVQGLQHRRQRLRGQGRAVGHRAVHHLHAAGVDQHHAVELLGLLQQQGVRLQPLVVARGGNRRMGQRQQGALRALQPVVHGGHQGAGGGDGVLLDLRALALVFIADETERPDGHGDHAGAGQQQQQLSQGRERRGR